MPEILPIDAAELGESDTRFLDRFRSLLTGRGLDVRAEAMDARHAGRAIVERARAHRASAVVLADPTPRRGRLGPMAAYALRHLDGPQLILVSG